MPLANLGNAVQVATLKDVNETEQIYLLLGKNELRLASRYRGVEVSVRAQNVNSPAPLAPIPFCMPHSQMKRLVGLERLARLPVLNGQVVIMSHDAELRLKAGTTRLRLSVASAAVLPPVSNDDNAISFDPETLKIALRNTIGIVAGEMDQQASVKATNGRIYAGDHRAVVISSHPELKGLNFQICRRDARLLGRVVGRMRGPAYFSNFDGYCCFRDKLIECNVQKSADSNLPIDSLIVSKPDFVFRPIAGEALKETYSILIVCPHVVTLEWPAGAGGAAHEHVKIRISANGKHPPDRGFTTLATPVLGIAAREAGRISLDASLWMKALQVFGAEATEWQIFPNKRLVKLRGIVREVETEIYLAGIVD